jgi:hypothetical protein
MKPLFPYGGGVLKENYGGSEFKYNIFDIL